MKTISSTIWIYLAVHLLTVCSCCKPSSSSSSSRSYRRGKSIAGHTEDAVNSLVSHRVRVLNRDDENLAITPNLRIFKGEQTYGRLHVPWHYGKKTLKVTAYWEHDFYSTPLWIYLKKNSLPSSSDHDKTSISYISRHYSRVKMDPADSGTYYIMIEALEDIYDLTIEVAVDTESAAYVEEDKNSGENPYAHIP